MLQGSLEGEGKQGREGGANRRMTVDIASWRGNSGVEIAPQRFGCLSYKKEAQVLAAAQAGRTTTATVDPGEPSTAQSQRSVTFPSPQLIRTTGQASIWTLVF